MRRMGLLFSAFSLIIQSSSYASDVKPYSGADLLKSETHVTLAVKQGNPVQ
jgi:hypothetical protein